MSRNALMILAAAALTACGGSDDTAATDTMTPAAAEAPMPAPAAAAPAVTDPQIAAIVVAANNADIAAGRLAASKSSNAQVKEFGQMMVRDHDGINKAATALVTKLGVTPEENPASQEQKTAGEQNLTSLQGLSGAEFDRAYMANEVRYHEALLAAIDSTLIPSAQNAELKTLLEQTRPAVVAHLEKAKQVQGALGQ